MLGNPNKRARGLVKRVGAGRSGRRAGAGSGPIAFRSSVRGAILLGTSGISGTGMPAWGRTVSPQGGTTRRERGVRHGTAWDRRHRREGSSAWVGLARGLRRPRRPGVARLRVLVVRVLGRQAHALGRRVAFGV